jgi:uncharacterized membrane protein
MNKTTPILIFIFGAFIMIGGINHFIKPEMYYPFIPDFLPKIMVNYVSGIIEITLGIGLFLPKYRKVAALGILILMIAFLPLHFLDIFKENPAIGSKNLAYIRLPLQFVLIYWSWWVKKNVPKLK